MSCYLYNLGLYNLGLICDYRGLFHGIIGALMVFSRAHRTALLRPLKRLSSKHQSHAIEDSLMCTLTCSTSHR